FLWRRPPRMTRAMILTLALSSALVAARTPVLLNACAATSCLVGTVCLERNGVAQCVAPPNSSPPSNGKCTVRFEEWTVCATCEPTCYNRTPACAYNCQPARCMCRHGFFRSKEGQCVTENDCDAALPRPLRSAVSQQCGSNQVFNECSSECPPKCGEDNAPPCPPVCGPPKCECKAGFYLTAEGFCVTKAECVVPQQCGKNQVFRECSSPCAPKCGQYGVRPCMTFACGPPQCECEVGFYRDSHGECVSRAECEAQSSTPKTPGQDDCQPNEIFRECSTMCEQKCGNQLVMVCPASCGPPKCQC
ncbi:hypothetical protein PMAYCL1PPCAC_32397, partial [Pristionchus mayeri]